MPPNFSKAPIGDKIRYLRRRMGKTPAEFAAATGIGHNTLLRAERNEVPPRNWVIGRVLRYLGAQVRGMFPGTKDIYDLLIPPKDFGSWLVNFRLRRGMQQKQLAKALGLNPVHLLYYEKGKIKPSAVVAKILIRRYRLKNDTCLRRFLDNGNT